MVTITRMQKLLLHYDNRPFESIDVILLICLFTQDTRSTRCNIKTIIKGDKSNLAEECGVKLFEQGVRNKNVNRHLSSLQICQITFNSVFFKLFLSK